MPVTVRCASTNAGKLGCYQIGDRRIVAESHLHEFLSLAERKAIVKTVD